MFVCFSFFFWLRVLDCAEYSAFESTSNSAIVSYRVVSYVDYHVTVNSVVRAMNMHAVHQREYSADNIMS